MRKRHKVYLMLSMASILILVMSVVVSCGYRPEKDIAADQGNAGENDLQCNDPGVGEEDEKEAEEETGSEEEIGSENGAASEEPAAFDPNHEYNEMIRVYESDVYVGREDGIYRVKGGVGEEELIFENTYNARRGMEIYKHYLYFCGFAGTFTDSGEGEREAATIYRLDLDTQKVIDTMRVFSQTFECLHNISVYEDKLYVAEGFGHRMGFELTPEGELGRRLDEEADDFLYKESNEYVEIEMELMSAGYGSEESLALIEKESELYQPLIDVATCKKLLNGSQVVSRYKDEACRGAYLEDEDGTYEYLCDIYDGYGVVTESGLYYLEGVSGDILYVDFETKQSKMIYKQPEDWMQICLLTYDEDYLYLATNRHLGFDEEDNSILEICLQRVPRQGGAMEKIYQFEEGLEWRMPWNFARHCGVYGGYMYLNGYETISIDVGD